MRLSPCVPAASWQDDVSVSDRVSLNLGLRFDRTNGHDMIAGEAQDEIITQFNNWSPRFGANFDVSGDGRAVVHASWGRFFEKISQGHISRATGSAFDVNSGFSPYQSYFFVVPEGMFGPGYDPFNPTDSQLLALQAAVFSPDNLTSDSSPSYPIDDNGLESLRTEAFNVGFEYEFTRDWVVGVDYIRKKDSKMFVWDDRTPNVFTPFEYTSPVIPGFIDTPITQTLYSKPDGNLDNVQINDPYYWRKHDIVTLQINRRPSSGFNFSASVTYQNNRGTIGNGDGESIWGRGEDQADNPNFNGHPFTGISPLQFSRKWSWKILANYTLPGDILAGLYWNWASGRPWRLGSAQYELSVRAHARCQQEPEGGRLRHHHRTARGRKSWGLIRLTRVPSPAAIRGVMAAERAPEIATATSASRLGPSSRADEVSAGPRHTGGGGVVGAVSSTALRRAPAHLSEEVLSAKDRRSRCLQLSLPG